jgi:hypothetical protein
MFLGEADHDMKNNLMGRAIATLFPINWRELFGLVTNQLTGTSNCLNVIEDGRNNKLTMAKCDNISGQSWKITKNPELVTNN